MFCIDVHMYMHAYIYIYMRACAYLHKYITFHELQFTTMALGIQFYGLVIGLLRPSTELGLYPFTLIGSKSTFPVEIYGHYSSILSSLPCFS